MFSETFHRSRLRPPKSGSHLEAGRGRAAHWVGHREQDMGSKACPWVVARDNAWSQLPLLSCPGPENTSLCQKNAFGSSNPTGVGHCGPVCLHFNSGLHPLVKVILRSHGSQSSNGNNTQPHPFMPRALCDLGQSPVLGTVTNTQESKHLRLPTGS